MERRKIYISLPDPVARRHGQVRVIDESGEDYVYPKAIFFPVRLPDSARRAVLTAT